MLQKQSASPGARRLGPQQPSPPVCSPGSKGQSPDEAKVWDEKGQ